MPKKLTGEARRKFERRAARNARLLSSTVPSDLLDTIKRADKGGADDVVQVIEELATFRDANAAYRGSNRYYYAALAKVYQVWGRIGVWSADKREAFFYQLNGVGVRVPKRGGDLHMLLRLMIQHSGDERAEQRLRTRDAGALRQAARLGWSAAELGKQFAEGSAGLDRLYRDDIDARREAPKTRKAQAPTVELRPKEPQPAPDSEDAAEDGVRLTWSKTLSKDVLIASTPRPHDALFLARIDPFTRKITLKRAYLTEFASLDAKQLREARSVLQAAGLLKRRVGRARGSSV